MCAEPNDISYVGPVEQRLLSVTEAAEYLRIEPGEVARAIRRGQLPSLMVDGVVLLDGESLTTSLREPYDGV